MPFDTEPPAEARPVPGGGEPLSPLPFPPHPPRAPPQVWGSPTAAPGAGAEAVGAGGCGVLEQKETATGLRDEPCGRETPPGHAGLCR